MNLQDLTEIVVLGVRRMTAAINLVAKMGIVTSGLVSATIISSISEMFVLIVSDYYYVNFLVYRSLNYVRLINPKFQEMF